MLKNILVLILVLCSKPVISQQGTLAHENPYGLSERDVEWMREATMEQLQGCRVKGADDTWIHTPDGIGNYKALWTRDYYYMVEYAGDLMDPEEIRASIYYLLNGQREDGCIPDRVNISGKAVYSPGPDDAPMADHAMDNGPFMALLVCSYVRQFKDESLFRDVEGKLLLGLDFINRDETGLVYNNPVNPQCTYGFTDIVKKTGHLLFSSLLYYKACREMEALCGKYHVGNSEVYKTRADKIQDNINILLDQDSGMFWAADRDCRQIDIWGSAYAVNVGITSIEQGKRISEYLSRNADDIILHGQIRHLSASDAGWNNLFIPCAEGTYQNGAYWATPLAWMVPVIAIEDLPLAKTIVQDAIDDFQENGINECINKGYIKIPNYVASATNVYCLTRFSKEAAAQSETWSGAQWIAFEKLEEDMRIVPGVHGFGDHLGEKGLKRSTVPMFRTWTLAVFAAAAAIAG